MTVSESLNSIEFGSVVSINSSRYDINDRYLVVADSVNNKRLINLTTFKLMLNGTDAWNMIYKTHPAKLTISQ